MVRMNAMEIAKRADNTCTKLHQKMKFERVITLHWIQNAEFHGQMFKLRIPYVESGIILIPVADREISRPYVLSQGAMLKTMVAYVEIDIRNREISRSSVSIGGSILKTTEPYIDIDISDREISWSYVATEGTNCRRWWDIEIFERNIM